MLCHNYLYTQETASKNNPNVENYQDIVSNAQQTSYFMTELASIYSFPVATGEGQTVAIVELGGGYVKSNIDANLLAQGLPIDGYSVTDINIDSQNNPGSNVGEDQENELDIQVVVSGAPKVNVRMYFVKNEDMSYYNACYRALITDKVKILTLSWGKPESQWDANIIQLFETLFKNAVNLGATIFAASGDRGSGDGLSGNNVDYPASSIYVCGVGGTSLTSANSMRTTEYVWNNNSDTSASGGGLSDVFVTPGFQSDNSSFDFQGKAGVPDVSAPADPHLSGYNVFIQAQGGMLVIGGTSGGAPFWAALSARLNELISPSTTGFLNPKMYPFPDTLFYDITVGNNGNFQAAKFWDPCTGNGSPIGTQFLALFQNPKAPIAKFSFSPTSGKSPLTVNFTDGSSNIPTSYKWDFGTTAPSATSNLQNPSFTFQNTETKTYTIILVVENTNGKSSVQHQVTVIGSGTTDLALPIWAIVLIVVGLLLLIILSAYFGVKHSRSKK
jgi:subtilase family serine protease